MSKLELNNDGTVTIPLRAGEPITLPEPSMSQLAKIHELMHGADLSLPPVIPVDRETATEEQLKESIDRLTERTVLTYEKMPYGEALVAVIKLLVPDSTVSTDDLPGWAANPQTGRSILTHFQTPLAG